MIREPHFHQFALAELLPFFEQFPTQYLSGERNIKLAYRHLVQPESAVRKLMILVNSLVLDDRKAKHHNLVGKSHKPTQSI